jgi:cytochrome b pre-mRNA-processing protein 3
MFKFFRRNTERDDAALELYSAAVRHARLPVYYQRFGVADTPDGRYDMIMIQVFLLLHRLKDGEQAHQDLAQAVFDVMFADMDQNLREMGAGDIGVAHRIKDMAKAFYGRIAVYDAGLAAPDTDELETALGRNLYRKTEPNPEQVGSMARHIREQAAHLAGQPLEALVQGRVGFLAPGIEGEADGHA